jgi:hypothetical protein
VRSVALAGIIEAPEALRSWSSVEKSGDGSSGIVVIGGHEDHACCGRGAGADTR